MSIRCWMGFHNWVPGSIIAQHARLMLCTRCDDFIWMPRAKGK